MATPTRKFDRLMAVPMFVVSLLFLVGVAGAVQEFRAPGSYHSPDRMRLFMFGALGLFPLFWAEAAWHYRLGSPLWRKCLIPCFFPPLRLAARDRQTGTLLWLPLLGWRHIDHDLQDDVQRAFSGPMIVVALMILPLLAIDFIWSHRINMEENQWLQILVETGYSVTWLAFTVEFVVMFSIVNHKLRYLKKHWVDLLIICLPLLAFLRAMQLSHLLRMQQVTKATRVYRLRGVALRVWRGILALDVLSRLIRISPERRIESLKQEIAEREREIDKLRREMARLEAELNPESPSEQAIREGEAA